MGSLPKSLLVAVAAILGLCALAGFGLGLSSTMARHAATAEEEQAPIAGNVPAGVTIKDAQPLVIPPPPPPPAPKPKAAASDAASDQPPADSAKPPAAPPAESAPGAPASLAPPPVRAPAAPLPNDLPPT